MFIDPAYWCERPDFFATIADAEPGQDRILAVLKWFISTLKDQYTSRNDQLGSEKKSASRLLFFIPFLKHVSTTGH
jgi:oxysterol-binding protein-related protein 9/10/11